MPPLREAAVVVRRRATRSSHQERPSKVKSHRNHGGKEAQVKVRDHTLVYANNSHKKASTPDVALLLSLSKAGAQSKVKNRQSLRENPA